MKFGAHVSSGGKIWMAADRAVETGCDCVQIFVSSPQMWRPVKHAASDIEQFRARCQAACIAPAVCHAVYLINLASTDDRIWQNSINSLRHALALSHQLGLDSVITHVGSTKGASFEELLPRIVAGFEAVLEGNPGVWLLLENSAGAGSVVGRDVDQLRQIGAALGWPERLGLCLDTCHAYAAGYDVATRDGLDRLVDEVDRGFDLERLRVIHANDSKGSLGSNVDRHAHIGEGAIGLEGFRTIVNHPAFAALPFIIETPELDGQPGSKLEADRRNLATLRSLVQGA